MPNMSDRFEFWEPQHTYVIGHQRPDTDSIAAALGYAYFLEQTGRTDVLACAAGPPGDQARYALERFEQSPPRLLTAVAVTFHHVLDTRLPVSPDAPLADALERLGKGEEAVPVADPDGTPRGVVTPLALARVFVRLHGHADTELPTCGAMAEQIPAYEVRSRISDHRNQMLRSEVSEFLVVDEKGRYAGIATQRRLLQPPRAKLILVDHNELSQAVNGAEEAEIVGVLDHHRLGNPPTASPIPFVVDPVGSTSTLVAEQCRARRVTPSRSLAGLLLSGILSDTLVFRSPTTDERDRRAAEWLGWVCQINVEMYGDELLRAAPGLGQRTPAEIVDTDRKEYEMGGVRVSIAQAEVTGMQEIPQRRAELMEALSERCEREGLSLIALMITDVVMGRSKLLACGDRNLVDALPFHREGNGVFDLGDIVSRKKQLAPAVQSAIESVQG